MKEIKFKGKNIEDGKWIYGSLITETYWDEFRAFIMDNSDEEKSIFDKIFEVYPETICQFTGLKDLNGKDVYEGDIVIAIHPNCYGVEKEEFKAVVVWSQKYLAWALEEDGNVYPLHGYKIKEVIGNIYDNPDLLKE